LDEKTEMNEILERSNVKRTMADWALQYVWDQPEVSVVLSGMSNMQQVIENVESANKSGSKSLSESELTTINELRDAFRKYDIVPCTSCKYCMPCPNEVTIPTVFRFLNELAYWGEKRSKIIYSFYGRLAKTSEEFERRKRIEGEVEGGAGLCTECGECLDKCPQQIEIPEMMKKAKAVLDNGQDISEVFD
jgi:predicted aldo/keto reductase-like oxidoreductase